MLKIFQSVRGGGYGGGVGLNVFDRYILPGFSKIVSPQKSFVSFKTMVSEANFHQNYYLWSRIFAKIGGNQSENVIF